MQCSASSSTASVRDVDNALAEALNRKHPGETAKGMRRQQRIAALRFVRAQHSPASSLQAVDEIHYGVCLATLHDYAFQVESRRAARKAVAQADFVRYA